MLKTTCNSQRGAVLMITAMILFIIALITTFAFNIGESALVKAQLQRAVDVAAKDAATQYCSLDSCFAEAQRVALLSLQQPTGFGLGPVTIGSGDGPVWENDAYKVTVQRGYWNWAASPVEALAADDAIDARFYPFESEGEQYAVWQSNHNTIGAGIFANAIYVKVVAKQPSFFSSLLGKNERNFAAESLAVSGSGSASYASPLAIPLESIITPSGDHSSFNPEELCKGDIYFTDTQKAETPVNSFPGFMWEPTLIGTSSEKCATKTSKTFAYPRFYDSNITPENINDHRVELNNRLRAHFAFVGSNVVGESESLLRERLVGSSNNVALGDTFNVHKDGLTQADSDGIIWNWILNGNRSVYSINARPFVGKMAFGDKYASACKVARVSDADETVPQPLIRQGACNSKRVTITDSVHGYIYDPTTPVALVEPGELVSEGANGVSVAKVKVPIVSKNGSLAVPQALWGAPELYDETANYKVIGFLTVYLYDVDVGHMPYQLPATISIRSLGKSFSTASMLASRGPWGYLKDINDSGSEASCNLIRARIDCDTSLVPSGEESGRTTVTFVK